MADLYRIEFVFKGRRDSWTEAYVQSQDGTNTDAILQDWFANIAPARTAMLGRGYSMIGLIVTKFRFSNGTPVTGVVSVLEFELLPSQLDANAGAQQDLAVQMKVINQSTGKRTFMPLGGFPDAVEVNTGIFTADPVGWGTKFNTFVVQLQSRQVGWIRQERDTTRVITGYVQNPAGEVTFTVNGAAFVAPFPGAKQSVRVSGLNGGSELNRQLVVRATAAQTLATVKPYFVAPFATNGQMAFTTRPWSRATQFVANKIVRRKRGSSIFSSRGRSKAQLHG